MPGPVVVPPVPRRWQAGKQGTFAPSFARLVRQEETGSVGQRGQNQPVYGARTAVQRWDPVERDGMIKGRDTLRK